jgi:DNA-directed RNA polymerase specialized sigma24 family protein/DNA-binding CsgD family transcriptional regulator
MSVSSARHLLDQAWEHLTSLETQYKEALRVEAQERAFSKSPIKSIKQFQWQALPNPEREVLALHLFGFNHSQIAEITKKKNGRVVTTILTRAKNKLSMTKRQRLNWMHKIQTSEAEKKFENYNALNRDDRLLEFLFSKRALVNNSALGDLSEEKIFQFLRKLVQGLDLIDQQILTLYIDKRKTDQEIAKALKMDDSTIFARRQRIKEELIIATKQFFEIKKQKAFAKISPYKLAFFSPEDLDFLKRFLTEESFFENFTQQHSSKRSLQNKVKNLAKRLNYSQEEIYRLREFSLHKRDINFVYKQLESFLFAPKNQDQQMQELYDRLARKYSRKDLIRFCAQEIKHFSPRTNKRIFKLFLKGYSQGAIARTLAKNQSAISKSLARTRLRLLKAIQEKL